LLDAPSKKERLLGLLSDETTVTYERLRVVCEQAWDMVDALTDRIAEETRG
jgi:hypothetical protein